MNRLKTAKSTATTGSDCWGLDYTYDRYANLTNAAISSDRGGSGCSAPTLSLSVSTSTNKITSSGFTYDAAGNLTSDGTASYTWNAEGRMASTAGMNYTYDGDGRRAKKAAGSPSSADRLYWYGINGEVLVESDWGGTLISEYIYFGASRIARRDVVTGSIAYYLTDYLGNASVLVNTNGAVIDESDFYPFGAERPVTDSLDNNHKMTGHERDLESGLDHTWFRQYSCNTGRWLSPDSMRGAPADPQSWNRYAYVGNNPKNAFDPNGKQKQICTEIRDRELDHEVVSLICYCLSGCGGSVDPYGEMDGYIPNTAEENGEFNYGRFSRSCRDGLTDAHPGDSNYEKYLAVFGSVARIGAFKTAGAKYGIDWRLLAAIGIRESNAGLDQREDGGWGRGYYQIDMKAQGWVGTEDMAGWEARAMDFDWATDFAAAELARRRDILADVLAEKGMEMYSGDDLLRAMGATWNMYPSPRNYSGIPELIDRGTTGNNYGSNIFDLMQCFKP
jgi:RHS repeat-associated protein